MAAVITQPSETMKIAPFTLVVSGRDSTTGDEVTAWLWDFGDGSSQDSSVERDMIAAHKYEHPGTYTVTLTIYDRQGDPVSTANTAVTVTSFSGQTYYVDSTNGSDGNNGQSPLTAWRTLAWAFANSSQSQNNPSKILLATGSVWVQLADLVMPSPCIIDSYVAGGSSTPPEIKFSGASVGLTQVPSTSSGFGVSISNVKVSHIGVSNTGDRLVVPRASGFSLRTCRIENGEVTAIDGSLSKLVIEDSVVVGSGRHGVNSAWSFGAVRRTSFLDCGSDYDNHHMLRLQKSGALAAHWLADQCVFDGGTAKQGYAAQFRAVDGWVLRRSTIKNCRFGVAAASYDLPGIGPDPAATDNGHIRGNVFSLIGKTYSGDTVGAHAIVLGWAKNIFVINNVFHSFVEIPGARGAVAVFSTKQGAPPNTENFIVFSNTFAFLHMASLYFSGEAISNIRFSLNISAIVTAYTPTGHVYCPQNWYSTIGPTAFFENNFYWFGGDEMTAQFSLDSATPNVSGGTWRNDEDNFGEFSSDPAFVNVVGHDYHLQSSSLAIDMGSVFLGKYSSPDFDGVIRPEGSSFDAGAFEYRIAVTTDLVAAAAGFILATAITIPEPFTTRPVSGTLSLIVGELLIDTEKHIPVRVESINGNLVRLRDWTYPDDPGESVEYLIYPQMRAALLSKRFERLDRIV